MKVERGKVGARLERQAYAPRLSFYDRLGKKRLWIGLQPGGTPAKWAECGGSHRLGPSGGVEDVGSSP